jgi:outer membrane protein assembly factor BamB
MNLRGLFHSERIAPEWRYKGSGLLWRILPSGRGKIVGECRNTDSKTASFFCLDAENGRPSWEDLRLDEPWWIGVETVQHDVVLFHAFAQPDMPAHKGVFAYDLATGRELWRNDSLTFWFADGACVYAHKDLFEKRVAYELDLKAGTVLRSFEESLEELHQRRHTALEQQGSDLILAPEFYEPASGGGDVSALLARVAKNNQPVAAPEFIRHRDMVALSYYTAARPSGLQKPTFENTLAVARLPGVKVVYHEVIGKGLVSALPASFFLLGSRLLYLRDQKELVALRLWQS